MMILEDLCDLFDASYVADKQNQLDKTYLASSEFIFSDGHYSHHVNSDGYISISNLTGANYIMFLDVNGDIFLAIYKYIPQSKYQDIVENVTSIRNATGMKKHSIVKAADPVNTNIDHTEVVKNDLLVDINNFRCPECKGEMFIKRLNKNPEDLNAKCVKCHTEYILTPSRYYVIKSKTRRYSPNDDFRKNQFKEEPKE